ncbi:hypothetical protein WIW50_16415 [Flavobacteriaceae bacterium 3-367]|uniref:hypothetical protein n=1 Tax=Eudoraea algarum TaxID=3417568 RepID=UPI00328769CB
MSQDLRDMFRKDKKEEVFPMKEGHEKRFLDRLEEELPQARKARYLTLKIAASVLLLVSLGFFTYNRYAAGDTIKTKIVDRDKGVVEEKGISLGDLSPDLKKVENYYVANINLELSQLEVSQNNKGLVDSFMERLAELNAEYQKLNTELNEIGPNDQTITALVKNLQLRLQLLQRLRDKLNELKSSKNEQVVTNTI